MDSDPGCCWRCGEPAQGSCPRCQMALYCSSTCLQDDRAAHLTECEETDTAERPCANCGRASRHLSRCARCHLAAYCSTECGDLHSRLHLQACLAGRDAVLRLANRLTHAAEPFRLPVYFGDGIHALNLLKNTDQTGEEPCQLLQLSAQLPHLLRTAAGVSDSHRPLLATLASDSSHQLARAYLLLYLLGRGAGPAATVQVMYSLRLSPEHARLLQAALEQLVTATYSQLLQLLPWVRIGRAALSHWQEVWRAWLQAMQDAGCLARMERCRDAALAEPETAGRLQRYLAALPDGQQRSARDFLLGHGTLMGDRQRRAAADCANVTLLALSPRDERHREAFADLRLGSEPPDWLEAAGGADTVLAPPPVPAGPLADWDRAEVTRALGADVDPADGCRRLAEDCSEAVEARVAAGRLSVRLVQFSSLSELDEQLAELRFERVFTTDTADRLGLFAVLEMAEVLLAPVPHALIVSSHSRWAALSSPAGTALSALRGSGSMAWDRQMDTEKFRLQTYLQGERLAYAARARHKDVLDPNLRVPTIPEVTSFGTLLMTRFSRRLQDAVPHKFRPERRLVSSGDETLRFLEWHRDPEGVRRRLAERRGPAEAAAPGDAPRPAAHRGPGLYERHLQSPASDGDITPVYGSIRRPGGSERRPNRAGPRPEHRSSLRTERRQHDGRPLYSNPEDVPDRRPDRTQSARRPRRAASAPLVRTESLPVAQRRRQDSRGFQPATEVPLYENPAAARAAARKAEREAAAREAAAKEAVPRDARSLASQQTAPERPRSGVERPQRRSNRRRTIETGPVGRPAQLPQTEPFQRTASLRVGKNHTPIERLRAPMAGEEASLRAERSPASRLPATLPRSLEGRFPSLRSPPSPSENLYSNAASREEEIYAVPRDGMRATQREQIYAVSRDTLRGAPTHQQSSVGRSGTPQFALSPGGTPYAVYGGQDRPRSPGTDSLGSQYDSPLSASHYTALQTPEGRRRLTNIFTFPPTHSERSASVSSVLSTSREASATPPILPAKRSAAARLRKTEQPPFSGAPLSFPRQHGEPRRPHQPERGFPGASLTLPRQASEGLHERQPDRSVTLPRQSSEPLHPLRAGQQHPRAYSGAPVPLPRQSADPDAIRRSEYDDYAVPQPHPRQLGGTSLGQQSASGSEDTLVSSPAEDEDAIGGSGPANTTTEPHEPAASPADIDRLTQWREPKSIGDWLRQDRTRQADFDRRAQPAAGDPRWTRAELAPLPLTSSAPTRPGRITPTTTAATSTSTAAEKRLAFLRNRGTTEERLLRSLQDEESAWWTKRPSSTDTATSEEHSSLGVSSPLHEATRSRDRRDFSHSGGTPSPKGELRPSGDALLSTEDLPRGANEPQTIAELGLRDTAAAWVLEQCLQEVLSEEREALRAQLIEWLEQKVTTEMMHAKEALKEAKAVSRGESTNGSQATPEPTPVPTKPAPEHTTPRDPNAAKMPASERPDAAEKETAIPAKKRVSAATKKGDVEVEHLSVPHSPDVAPPKLNQKSFSPFDVNSEESGKLGSPRFPIVDTPVPKSIPREKFFADLFQYKAPTTGERLVTLRLDATTEAPPSPGEESAAKIPLFTSSVIIPSPDRTLTVPQRIVIDVMAEPETVQPPAILVPLQPVVETEVKARTRPSTPPIQTAAPLSGEQPEEEQGQSSLDRTATPTGTNTADSPDVGVAVSQELLTPVHSPIREKADFVAQAMPFTKPHSPPESRKTVMPLSFLDPDNIGRVVITPSGQLHRSPVEEPYPALADDLSSRRARLEARAAARELLSTSTDRSSRTDSSPEHPQPPSSLSNLKASSPGSEAFQSALTSRQEEGNDGDSSVGEGLGRDKAELDPGTMESGSESANTSATYRSSLHIPMEEAREEWDDPQLQEILIKFPLVTLNSGEPQVGQPDVTISPRRKVEAMPTEQGVTQTAAGPAITTAESTEESVGQTQDGRADILTAPTESDAGQTPTSQVEAGESLDARKTQMAQGEVMITPSESYPTEADVSEDDHSTPPPLPVSPPPKSSVQPPFGMHGDIMTVETGTSETEGSVREAESDTVATKDGEKATDSGEVVTDAVAVEAEASAVEVEAGTVKTEAGALEAGTSAVEVEAGAVKTEAAAAETEAGAVKAEAGAVETEAGPVKTEAGAVEVVALTAKAVGDTKVADSGTMETGNGTAATKCGTEAANYGTKTKTGGRAAESSTGEANNNARAAGSGSNDSSGVAQSNTKELGSSSTSALRRHSVSDKQSQRLGNLVRRRRSRKMSMDKEYQDMKRKLTEANAGLVSNHDTESGEGHSQSKTNDAHPTTVPANRTTLKEETRSGEGAASTSRSAARSNGEHPGSLAKTRRKSRPLSMDAEYYAMKNKLQVHNGHSKDHDNEHIGADNTQRESATTQSTDRPARSPTSGEHRSDSAAGPAPTNDNQTTAPSPASTSQAETAAPVGAGQSATTATAAGRRASGRLSLDKEFFAMRAQLELHNDGHGSASVRPSPASTVPGFEPKDPPSPPSSPVSGPSPAVPLPRRGSRKMSLSMEEEFFAIRAAHMARHPVQSEPEEQTPPSSPKVMTPSLKNEERDIILTEGTEPTPSEGRSASTASSAATISPKAKESSDPVPSKKPAPLTSSTNNMLSTPAQAHKSPAPASSANIPKPLPASQTASPKLSLALQITSTKISPAPPTASPKRSPPTTSPKPSPAPAPPNISPKPSPPTTSPKASPVPPATGPKPSPAPAPPNTSPKPSPAPPVTSPKPFPASQTITLTPGHPTIPSPAAPDRRAIRPLPLDPELLASRARSERPPAGPVPQFPPTSPATPPPSPTSVLSRTGRPGSIRKRVQELERSVVGEETAFPSSPQQQSAPTPFSRSGRAGSVRDRIRRMEMLATQQGQPAAGAEAGKESPVPLRRHSTHSPFTRLGSGGGGGVSSLTVRLQPSPPGAAQRGSLSPTGPQPPTPVQRGGARQRRSLPAVGLWSGSPNTAETPTRAPSEDIKEIPEQYPESVDDASDEVSGITESSAPASRVEPSSTQEAPQPPQVTPPKPAARRVHQKTPSPPDLLAWPWTAEDDDAEARQAEQTQQNPADVIPVQSSSEQPNTSQRSGNSSPAYETVSECSFSPRASVGESRQARTRTTSEGPGASSGTEIDAQDDDVFTDATGMPAAATAMVTSL